MHAILTRFEDDGKQTLGDFVLHQNNGDVAMRCKTMELPWEHNAQTISCIPPGKYICRPRLSPRYGRHFHVLMPSGAEVIGRGYILIHHGNYQWDTSGCILLGQAHLDINGDGYRDVTSSKATMAMLNKVTDRKEFRLTIIDEAHGE